ncbi:DUF6382 domain-containing protein [Clostridiaceae bacterium M8S5]|nr:DUF6382 domain-containing protein [Clostridiaceae bacterium M8S5]
MNQEKIKISKNKVTMTVEVDEIIYYQVNMINNNEETNILPMNIKDTSIEYSINNLISLKEYISVSEDESIKLEILQQVINVIKNSKEFLLYQNSFIINSEYIFINETKDVILAYVPTKIDSDTVAQMRAIIFDLTDIVLTKEEASLDIIYEKLEKKKYKNQDNILKQKNEIKNEYKLKNKIKRNSKTDRNIINKSILNTRKQNKENKQKKQTNIKFLALFQILLIVLVLLTLNTIKNPDRLAYIVVIIVVIGIDTVVFRTYIKKNNEDEYSKN